MKKGVLITLISLLILALAQCRDEKKDEKKTHLAQAETSQWLNHADSVGYIGMETCQTCHANVHETFIKTGMGQSFGEANRAKSIAEIKGDSVLYDAYKDFYYRPFWEGDSLYLQEYRLRDGDTVHNLIQKIDFVIGSGQHTNSHLYSHQNYLFQSPFTWYAQKGKLDFPPGFENGNNTRFSRPIGLECMSCHNAMPVDFVKGSTNKFAKIDGGINCERCHGPGEAHYKKIMAGNITDTAVEADRSIVNPKRLSAQLQFEMCQRCHLQGNAVLKPNMSFFDFKPGMLLADVMAVFLPRYEGGEDDFIMASHADRFKQSACYINNSEAFTCTSCHNPHISVKETNLKSFNKTCQSCHGDAPNFECSASSEDLIAQNYNCVVCHMPPSSSIDIPHVTVHDHYIRKPKNLYQHLQEASEKPAGKFIGLEAINIKNPDSRTKALAYLQQYERFTAQEYYLDSAEYFISKAKVDLKEEAYLWSYFYFLKKDLSALVTYVDGQEAEKVLANLSNESYDNQDAWTAYRIGQAYDGIKNWSLAEAFYQRAVNLASEELDFQNKLALIWFKQNKIELAEAGFLNLLGSFDRHQEGLNNLAYLYLRQGNLQQADLYLKRVLKFHPDYELAWLNRANFALQKEDAVLLKASLLEVVRINPENQQAQELLNTRFN
jgi:predicted CXXCH cytochrome family protein